MNKNPDSKNQTGADFFLDITPDTCPITYVRTKLTLETMAEGQILEVRLIGVEPLENVPRTATANGHTVLSIEPEEKDGTRNDAHLLLIRRGATG